MRSREESPFTTLNWNPNGLTGVSICGVCSRIRDQDYAVRAPTIALRLLVTPALADVAGTASVIDGDTIEVHGQRIRLHGIDAPESRQFCRRDSKPWQCGKDAANALADKIARRPVTCEDLGRDRYTRIIARCTVAGEDLGEWMVA